MPFDYRNSEINLEVHNLALAKPQATKLSFFGYDQGVKRTIDLLLVLISAPIVVPLIAIIALLVALDGHAPFYTQKRIGRNGQTFRIFKIRTMVHNADELLSQHLETDPGVKLEWETTQKLKNDIRVTRIGQVLRKTSMDELPQLLNVLTGSMSLVGPRPMMLCQKIMYPGTAYYRMRPGITGFWQISERNDCDFRDRAKFDTAYEQEMSLATDLKVLWRTVAVVLRGTGY